MNCKNCGAELFEQNAVDGVIECEYCFSRYPVARKEASPAALEFLRMGEHDLDTGRFDDAYAAYEKAAQIDKEEPEAYFGMALALFKVQYVKDEVNNRLQPICHELTEKKFQEDSRYLSALNLATEAQRKEYVKRAEGIDYIRSEFVELKKTGLDFDCFLCVKVTGADGEKTEDSKDADYIYDLLKDRGYKPFYSERNIRNRTGADYEAMILYALHTAETMLVVCREEEYLQTPWVKNEYTRFLRLLNDSEKESDAVTIVYYEKPIEKLAGKRGKIQGIDFSRRDADRKICDFVESHTAEAKIRRQREEEEKKRREEKLLREIEEQKRAREEAEARLKTVQAGNASSLLQQELKNQINLLREEEKQKEEKRERRSSGTGYLLRAHQELASGDWDKAKEFFDLALNDDPEDGEAWLGLFLVERQKKSAQDFNALALSEKEAEETLADKYFLRAEQYGTDKIREDTMAIRAFCEKVVIAEQKKRERQEEKRKQFYGQAEIKNTVLVKYNGSEEFVTVPDEITVIGKAAFKGNKTLRCVRFPKNLKKINNSAFENCVNLSEVVGLAGVEWIYPRAFANCLSLTKITINGNEGVGKEAFANCNALTIYCKLPYEQVPVDMQSMYGVVIVHSCEKNDATRYGDIYKIIGGVRYCLTKGEAFVARQPKNLAGEVLIPAEVAYKNKKYPVMRIQSSAFSGCDQITHISIGDNIQKVGWLAFEHCNALESIAIGAGISKFSFSEAANLPKLERIDVAENNAVFASQDGIVYDKNKTHILFIPQGVKGNITLPAGIAVARGVFAGRKNIVYNEYGNANYLSDGQNPYAYLIGAKNQEISSCEIHRDTVAIAQEAFSGCAALSKITIPESVGRIGAKVFARCAKELIIDCEAEIRPAGWDKKFDKKGGLFAGRYKVNWSKK